MDIKYMVCESLEKADEVREMRHWKRKQRNTFMMYFREAERAVNLAVDRTNENTVNMAMVAIKRSLVHIQWEVEIEWPREWHCMVSELVTKLHTACNRELSVVWVMIFDSHRYHWAESRFDGFEVSSWLQYRWQVMEGSPFVLEDFHMWAIPTKDYTPELLERIVL